MKIGGKTFEVNNKNKIFYPDANYSKQNIMDYYEKIAPFMLSYIKNRPITMVRFPDGIDGKKFYQKDEPDYFPKWIKTQTIQKKEDGKTKYVVCNDKATLVYLASQACLSSHIWTSQIDKIKKPDKLILDLDPSDKNFETVKFAAKIIHDFFEQELKITPFVMTTGSRGLHIAISIKPEITFDKVLNLAQNMTKYLAAKHPNKLTTAARKNKRGDRLYLDVARNAFGQTSVSPYSLRSIKNAPVATPIEWKELKTLTSAQKYNLSSIFKRLAQKKDPWEDF